MHVYSETYKLVDAVSTAAGAQSSVRTAKFRNFTWSYTLDDTIASGSITVSLQFRNGAGDWITFDTVVISSSGSSPEWPATINDFVAHDIRATVTAHDAINGSAAAVAISVQMEAGS